MKKALFILLVAVFILASNVSAFDRDARFFWSANVASSDEATEKVGNGWTGKWITGSGDRIEKLLLPCGTGLDWNFDVLVKIPYTMVVSTGSASTHTEVVYDSEYLESGMVYFTEPGTYLIKHAEDGHPPLLVRTTCQEWSE